MNKQPTNEELKVAINRHVEKSAQMVARIPRHLRTIVSNVEIKALYCERDK